MSIIGSLFRKQPQAASLSLTDATEWRNSIVPEAASGVHISPGNALTYSAIYACVRVLAESVASLPLIVYQRDGELKQRAREFPLYRILHDQPNPLMTSFQFRETLMGHLLLWGNAYAEIAYNGAGRIEEMWPLRPDKMRKITVQDGMLMYEYELPNGRLQQLPGWRVFHLRGLSPDGLMGYSPIALQRDAAGLGKGAEMFGSKFFANGARPSGVLTYPSVLDDEAYKRLKADFQDSYSGISNALRVAILEEGLDYKTIGVPPEDAQFLETRKFQRAEIAGVYRVPPHMIGDLERATFSNIEHQSIEFVTHSLRPWLIRWEQAINSHLLTTGQQQEYYAEHLVDALLRGDTASRYAAYAVGRQWGWLSADDVRQLENMNPLPSGQGRAYLTPLNMVPADEAQAMAEASPPQVQAGAQQQTAHYRLLAEEAAGRVVRKEIAALTRAWERCEDGDGWKTAVSDFYREHVRLVAQSLQMPTSKAFNYCINRTINLSGRSDIPNYLIDSEYSAIAILANMALGEHDE